MRLPEDAIIAPAKLRDYLLAPKARNDKSKWLNRAGYSFENWQKLETDLREQILSQDAQLDETNRYGDMYRIEARLTGPNNQLLSVVTIWMIEKESGATRFITMYPLKE
jgi:hypothetical protein